MRVATERWRACCTRAMFTASRLPTHSDPHVARQSRGSCGAGAWSVRSARGPVAARAVRPLERGVRDSRVDVSGARLGDDAAGHGGRHGRRREGADEPRQLLRGADAQPVRRGGLESRHARRRSPDRDARTEARGDGMWLLPSRRWARPSRECNGGRSAGRLFRAAGEGHADACASQRVSGGVSAGRGDAAHRRQRHGRRGRRGGPLFRRSAGAARVSRRRDGTACRGSCR
jgi:hypothetical protein